MCHIIQNRNTAGPCYCGKVCCSKLNMLIYVCFAISNNSELFFFLQILFNTITIILRVTSPTRHHLRQSKCCSNIRSRLVPVVPQIKTRWPRNQPPDSGVFITLFLSPAARNTHERTRGLRASPQNGRIRSASFHTAARWSSPTDRASLADIKAV